MNNENYDIGTMLRMEISYLFEIASHYYKNRQLDNALAAYQKLLVLANKINDENFTAYICLDCGNCLMQMGRLKEAIVILAPNLSKTKTVDPEVVLGSLIRWIEIAQQIPQPIEPILKTYQQAEELLKFSGKTSYRHELLVHRTRLEMYRGNWNKSLDLAQEALNLKIIAKDAGGGQVFDYHYYGLIEISLALNDFAEARRLLNAWNGHRDVMPANRVVRMNKCKADIAFREGNIQQSIAFATVAVEEALSTDYEETLFSSLCSLLNGLLAAKKMDLAKFALGKLWNLRKTERSYIRFQVFSFLGDYAKIKALDNPKKLSNAYSFYYKAKEIALAIDTKLDTTYRTDLINQRLNAIESL